MKHNPFTALWRSLTNTRVSQPKALPTVISPRRDNVKLANLGGTLRTLNDEFKTLNDKLFELRGALGNLRDALKALEEAKARRAEQSRMLLPARIDNTLN